MLVAIWAMDHHQLIGAKDKLPWHISADLKHFYQVIKNQNILVGNKTFINLPNIVFQHCQRVYVATRQKTLISKNNKIKYIYNVQKFTQSFIDVKGRDLIVIGGAEIYRLLLNSFDRLIVSLVAGVYQGDVFFPKINWKYFRLIKKKVYQRFTVLYYRRISDVSH